MIWITAFISYETPQFPCGGVAAVLGKLPLAMQAVSSSRTIVIAPRHISSAPENKIQRASTTPVGTATFRHVRDDVPCTAVRLDGDVPTYFVGCDWIPPDGTPVFAGARHPYDVGTTTLLRDALVFGAAVAALLPLIGDDVARQISLGDPSFDRLVRWRLIMQDWEAATAALSVAETSIDASLHLVLHNSYDAFAPRTSADPSIPSLATVGITATPPDTHTILNRVLPRVRQPVFTVSTQFARELTHDLLQTDVMAPHLQPYLSVYPVFGVDNGPFTQLQVPGDVLNGAVAGDLAELIRWKTDRRKEALAALRAHQTTADKPIWGDRKAFAEGARPWIVMAGRDDPRQKGYDVAAHAVERYLTDHGEEEACPQFLFFAIPGDEGLAGLRFLQTLAESAPRHVIVLPFRWTTGYVAGLQASSYGLMPSLYEPFGMANEFYLAGGCVGIGRATGGNIQQIVPLWASRSYSAAVRDRAGVFHAMSSPPTGLLFREPDGAIGRAADWRAINAAAYVVGSTDNGRVAQRSHYAVFRSMANELRWSIEDGMRIWRDQPDLYGRMLSAGVQHITQTFSWQRAAQEYARYTDADL